MKKDRNICPYIHATLIKIFPTMGEISVLTACNLTFLLPVVAIAASKIKMCPKPQWCKYLPPKTPLVDIFYHPISGSQDDPR